MDVGHFIFQNMTRVFRSETYQLQWLETLLKLCGVTTGDFGFPKNVIKVIWNLIHSSRDLQHLLSGIYTPQLWIYNLQNQA